MDLLGNDTRGAYTFSSLRYKELAFLLDGGVDIVPFGGTVREVIVSNVVNLMLFQEVVCDDPGTVLHHLVDPLAMPHGLGSFLARQHGQSLACVRLLVAGDADKKVNIGEGLLGLFKLAHVAKL